MHTRSGPSPVEASRPECVIPSGSLGRQGGILNVLLALVNLIH